VYLQFSNHKSLSLIGLVLSVTIGVTLAFCVVKLSAAYSTGPTLQPVTNSMEKEESAPGSLKIGTNVPFTPFEYYSGTQLVGFDIDLMDAIALEANFGIEYITVEWQIIFETLISGEVDALISGLTVTPDREQRVDFTLPYLTYDWGAGSMGIAVQQDNGELRQQMNAALWQLLEDGTIQNLIDKYFGAGSGILPPEWPVLSPITETLFVYTDSLGNPTTIQAPAGAVTEPTVLQYTPVSSTTVPAGFSVVGQGASRDHHHPLF
jgi:ABC-type amino acid transport substrate-binding protein